MNNHSDIEKKLERLAETVSLRADEKDLHRENLKAFMAKGRKPVPSPYTWLWSPATRYASALMLLVVVGASGTVAAEGSRPGDALYAVKLKVTEPTRAALTLDREEKTAFELERADRRLKEFAQYATERDADPETVALITSSLEESIGEVTDAVDEYAASGDTDVALAANTDLQSVLSAHSLVLDAIAKQHPDSSEEVEAVSESVDAGIADTENAEDGIEEALLPAVDGESLATIASEARGSYQDVSVGITEGRFALDASDRGVVDEALAGAQEILDEAGAAENQGDLDAAFLLYAEAGQRLDELTTLIEADRDLDIGVIDPDE